MLCRIKIEILALRWHIDIKEKEKTVEIPVDRAKERLQLLLSSDNAEMRIAARNMFLDKYELSVMCEKYIVKRVLNPLKLC